MASFKHHTAPITSIEWNPNDSSVLAASGSDDQISIWDLAVEKDSTEANAAEGEEEPSVPPQLLFIHQGQTDIKELHWHPQLLGVIISTAHSGFNVFRTISVWNLDHSSREKGQYLKLFHQLLIYTIKVEGWSCFCYLVHWFWESFLFMNHILHVKESFKFALWIYQLLFHKNSMRWLSRKILQYFRQKCNCNFCVWCSLVFAVLQIKKIDS